MVAFHDRRTTAVSSVDEIAGRLPLSEGDTLGKHMIDGRYLVRGTKTEEGRKFVVHEVLPNGAVIQRGEPQARRKHADRLAESLQPTSTYNI